MTSKIYVNTDISKQKIDTKIDETSSQPKPPTTNTQIDNSEPPLPAMQVYINELKELQKIQGPDNTEIQILLDALEH